MRRICFGWHPGDSLARPLAAPERGGSLGRSSDPRYGALRRDFARTGNMGYLVIGEAAGRLFACDRERSAFIDVRRLAAEAEPAAMAARLDRDFDLLVLPMAYEIAPEADHERVAALLAQVRLPIVSLGLGLMCDPETPPARLGAGTRRLLDTLEARAVVFGVRAGRTEGWLHRHGWSRAQALGCPSLHLYRHAVARLAPPARPPERLAIATGGYLLRDLARGRALCGLLASYGASYFVQDEIFAAAPFGDEQVVIDDARRLLDRAAMDRAIEAWGAVSPGFARYFYCDGLDAWRAAMAMHDLYIGDRFHGGVVAIQVGLPTILFCRDVRADELSAFYDVPRLDLASAAAQGLAAAIDAALTPAALTRFKDVHAMRDARFWAAMRQAGLSAASG